MSQRDDTRSCPRCEHLLSGREHFGEAGLTVIWRCPCGWASARTVSCEPVLSAPVFGVRHPGPLPHMTSPSVETEVRPAEAAVEASFDRLTDVEAKADPEGPIRRSR